MISLIELKNISKKYGEKTIIDNINLTLNAGQITFIVGTSGTGKTTLLNIIGGLSNPTSGKILFNGKNIDNDLNTYRGKNVGFVFQDFNLISGLTIVENVEIATEIAGLEKNTDEIILEVKNLGISDPYQKVETLSGGEKQRTAIVRSICKDADVLIADEPTGNLDSQNACLVLDMLQSIKANKHIIVVSHDMEKAKKYADRIITLKDGVVISDEITVEKSEICKSNVENIDNVYDKKSLFKTIYRLGRNSVIIRKGKIISIALVIAMAIAAMSTVVDLNRSGNNISHNVNTNYLETDLINLYYASTPNAGYMELPFSHEEIISIDNDREINEKVLLYFFPTNEWLFSADSETVGVCIKQININDFFQDRVLSNDIDGRFIKDKNEIILAEDVAKQLFGEECIGKVVTLNSGRGNSIDYTIVGINYTRNPSDQIYSFISSESLKDMLAMSMEETIFERQELSSYQTEVQNMLTGGIYGSMLEVEKTEDIVYGKYPSSSEEVMISSFLLSQVLGEFEITTNYSYDQIVAGEMSSEDINKIFLKKFALNFNGVFPVYISGVYNSENVEMRFSNELITNMRKVDPISIDIYVANSERVFQIKDRINENNEFEATSQLETLKDNVSMQTRFFTIALILLGVVLICISCALLSSFIKISVLERKKEVAIIKSLGANNPTVLYILIFDAAVISVLSFLIAIIFAYAIKFVIPLVFANSGLLMTGGSLGVITLIGLMSMLLIFLQTGLSLRKLVKQMPADLLVL